MSITERAAVYGAMGAANALLLGVCLGLIAATIAIVIAAVLAVVTR